MQKKFGYPIILFSLLFFCSEPSTSLSETSNENQEIITSETTTVEETLINESSEQDEVSKADDNQSEAEKKYRKGWEDNLISYPELTSDEIKTSLLLEEYEFEYEWSFETTIEEVTFVCKHKTTGTSIMAFANENHPLLINEDFYRYQIEVHYNCSSEENDGFVLYGPLFFQDNQWWGFIEYEDEYSSNYEGEIVYAFMNKFVKRVSLGQEILPSS